MWHCSAPRILGPRQISRRLFLWRLLVLSRALDSRHGTRGTSIANLRRPGVVVEEVLAAASPSEQGMLAEHPQLGCLAGCLSRNRRSRVYRGETKRVVIVGGGFAAVHMCEELAKQPHDIKITMICPNDHLDIAWASPRAIARPETANRNVIPFHKIFERSKHAASMVTHVHDTVAWVTETYVETAMSCEVRSVHDPPRRVASDRPASLEPARLPFPALVRPSTFRCVPSDARVPVPVRPLPLPDAADPRTHPTPPHAQKYEYDVLVIGTGATYAEGSEAKRLKSNHTSMSGKDRVKELRELAERVKGAKGVMVVGAGPTGIELAAELGAAYPRVPVKLVTNKYEIGAGMPKPVKAALQQAFVSRPNVTVIAGERGSVLDAKRHGCDVVFMCAGMEPNTSFLGGGSLKASLDEKGFVKTGLTGQVLGFPNVFALGDCAKSYAADGSGMEMMSERYRREHDTEKFARRVCALNVLRCIAGEALVDKAAKERRWWHAVGTHGGSTAGGGGEGYVYPGAVISLSPSDSVGYVQGSVARGWYMAARKRKDLWRMRLSKKLTGHDGPHYT